VNALVRPAAVAGSFYPGQPAILDAALDAAFADARGTVPDGLRPKAIVAPHAGYVYSGPIAASAYRCVATEGIARVVLLGPSHFVAFDGLAVSPADAFATPLGQIAIDVEAREAVAALDQVIVNGVPHADEHSLEVQLPFLQRRLGIGGWTLLPLAVGFSQADAVAEVLKAVWGGAETLVVISTDLSHYLDAASARERDARTADAVVALEAEAIGDRDACGCRGLRGLLVAARERGMEARLLDLRDSADTAGDPERVVGYGAFAFV
jgi:hypothetical protein